MFYRTGCCHVICCFKNEIAIKAKYQIMTAFVQMRKYINSHYQLYQKIKDIEKTQIIYGIKTDERFNQIFKAITANNIILTKNIL